VESEKQYGPARSIFPSHAVAKETARVNSMYRFALGPGHYVLAARFPHSNVRPFVQITVEAGKTIHADIPNMCK
jgi:hypothetical protein